MAETLDRNPHAAVRPDWLALRTEAIIEPELKIVDPHHHLWDRQDNRYLFHDLTRRWAGCARTVGRG